MEPIQDHALIGDCRAAALVSRGGAIDWLCWPRFDSPSVFGALLDDKAGHWTLQPTSPFESSQRYLDGTNILETRFVTPGGIAVVTDLMPVASEEDKHRFMVADHEILRVVRGEEGETELAMFLQARPGYGSQVPRLKDAGKLGVRIETAQGMMMLRSDVPLSITADGTVEARFRLRSGEAAHLSLTLADEWPAILSPLGAWSREAVERSARWWRSWLSRITYDGPARGAVERSALVLKLLVFAPSGAVVAAPTTSLPERVGGDLNWDYRFCWLRDASLTVRALFGLGFDREAETFMSWLLHSTRLTQPELRILYDVYGNLPREERVLSDVSGYLGSRPVRIGNAATDQVQLDVYGEVIDAVAQFVRRGGKLDRETERMLRAFGEYVCRHWQQPDEGIWEPRSGKQHNTHSRVLCWVALDNLLALDEQGHLRKAPAELFAKNRALIRKDVEEHAWNTRLQSYTAQLDGEELDASTLLLAWYGFEPAASERMRLTYQRIRERLGAGNGLLYRYRRTAEPEEGAFGICSFWAAEYLALGGGSIGEACSAFETLCSYANGVGLFAEEIEPATGEAGSSPQAVGNFPQAFTHVGLINAALSLSDRLEREKSRDPCQPREEDRGAVRP
jgi:GH15 family glucan-1,4-alpha-glucosidase